MIDSDVGTPKWGLAVYRSAGSINEPINVSINESIDEPINESISESSNETFLVFIFFRVGFGRPRTQRQTPTA